MRPYDIDKAFAAIEDQIIKAMITRFKRDRAKGHVGAYEWQDWRIRQLKGIEEFRKKTLSPLRRLYRRLNRWARRLISKSFDDALRREIEQAVKATPERASDQTFWEINRTRMEALQEAAIEDLNRAEAAVFRRTEDLYRQIIYRAQIGLNSGLYTYDQAVDAATKDFLAAGINCVVYKNGSRHTVREYASMALRTSMKRAALMAEGEIRDKVGIHTVYARWRDMACPECMRFLGRVMVDDVYSHGTRAEAEAGGYLLLSDAMADGFLHPNCKDTITTYDPERWKNDPKNDPLKMTEKKRREYEEAAKLNEKNEQMLSSAKMRHAKYMRLAEGQLDPKDRKKYEGLDRAAKRDIEQAMQNIAEDEGMEGFERAIANEPVEWSALFTEDKYGDFVVSSVHTHTDWEHDWVSALSDDLVRDGDYYGEGERHTHNHPVEEGQAISIFSPDDIDCAAAAGLAEERARWYGGVHVLRREHDPHVGFKEYQDKVWRDAVNTTNGECYTKFAEAYRLEYDRLDKKWGDWAVDEFAKWFSAHTSMTSEEAQIAQNDIAYRREEQEEKELEEWLTKNAPKYGWTYEHIRL